LRGFTLTWNDYYFQRKSITVWELGCIFFPKAYNRKMEWEIAGTKQEITLTTIEAGKMGKLKFCPIKKLGSY